MIQMKATIHKLKSPDKLKAEWAKRLRNLLQLDGPSFDELLKTATHMVAKIYAFIQYATLPDLEMLLKIWHS